MIRALTIAALLPLAGCTIDLNTRGICIDEGARGYVGQVYSDAIADRIKDQSRATRLRAIRPGDMTTMEVDKRRVNVVVDENNRVTRTYCG